MILRMRSLVLITLVTWVGADNPSVHLVDDDVGQWTVKDCILVKMKGQFEFHPDSKDVNTTLTVDLPQTARVSNISSCLVSNTSQQLELEWEEPDPTYPDMTLSRTFTIIFSTNTSSTPPRYGVSKISGVYDLKTVNQTDPEKNTSTLIKDYISFTTFSMSPWEFMVQRNKSYLCSDLGSKSMEAELHKSNERPGDPGEKLRNATFSATLVQFDAFRPADMKTGVFQAASDCNYRPNDIVPIIVGCALAGMVVMVLVAYMVGRSRSRARGYMSV